MYFYKIFFKIFQFYFFAEILGSDIESEKIMRPSYRPIPPSDPDLVSSSYTSRIEVRVCSMYNCNRILTNEMFAPMVPDIIMVIEDIDDLVFNRKLAFRIGQGCAKMSYLSLVVLWNEFQPSYFSAVANSHGVAKQIVKYVIRKLRNVHLIGIGVGAHVAGFVGKKFKELNPGRIKRITGLDPSRILFEYKNGPTEIRLDVEDAEFVDVYHSDYKGKMRVGFIESIGTVDFYERGGSACEEVPTQQGDSINIWRSDYSVLSSKISQCKHNLAAITFLSTLAANCSLYGVRNPKDECVIENCLGLGMMVQVYLYNTKIGGDSGNYIYNVSDCTAGVPSTAKKFQEVYDAYQKGLHPLIIDHKGWMDWINDAFYHGIYLLNSILGAIG